MGLKDIISRLGSDEEMISLHEDRIAAQKFVDNGMSELKNDEKQILAKEKYLANNEDESDLDLNELETVVEQLRMKSEALLDTSKAMEAIVQAKEIELRDKGRKFNLQNIAEYGSEVTKRGVEIKSLENIEPSFSQNNIFYDPTYRVAVFDYHNYALLFWNAALNSEIIPKDANLLHIDGHMDMAESTPTARQEPLKTFYDARVFVESNHIERFIKPAIKWGIVGNKTMLGDKNFIKKDKLTDISPDIFDLDLDVYDTPNFQQNPDRVKQYSYKESYERFAEIILRSNLTTIAFSPDYIDHKEAVKHFQGIKNALYRIQ